jgi:uncharacterized protein YegP (UPF0339 family)
MGLKAETVIYYICAILILLIVFLAIYGSCRVDYPVIWSQQPSNLSEGFKSKNSEQTTRASVRKNTVEQLTPIEKKVLEAVAKNGTNDNILKLISESKTNFTPTNMENLINFVKKNGKPK